RRLNTLDRTTQVIYFLLGLLEILLALRFVFRIINSNTANGFVNFIYNLTAPFVAPFNGIFNDQAVTRGSVVEFSTLIAMAIYALIAWGIVKLLNVLLRPNPSSREVFTNTRRMS
ncbi:MAG TPA: YggT family protein, partial [Chloroflexia bacterium]|nr:YggT family protein [Chloroflexia bacterium]